MSKPPSRDFQNSFFKKQDDIPPSKKPRFIDTLPIPASTSTDVVAQAGTTPSRNVISNQAARATALAARRFINIDNAPVLGSIVIDDVWEKDDDVEQCLLLLSQETYQAELNQTTDTPFMPNPTKYVAPITDATEDTISQFKSLQTVQPKPAPFQYKQSKMLGNKHVLHPKSYGDHIPFCSRNKNVQNPTSKRNYASSSTNLNTRLQNKQSADMRVSNVNPPFKAADMQCDALVKEVQKLRMKNKMWEDKWHTKEGEVTILRTKLNDVHSKVETCKLLKLKALEDQSRTYEEKLTNMKKELEKTKIELTFKDMEKGKSKTLEVENVKLVEQKQTFRRAKPKVSTATQTATSTTPVHIQSLLEPVNNSGQLLENHDYIYVPSFNDIHPQGTKLGNLLIPYLCVPSAHEILLIRNWDQDKPKFKLELDKPTYNCPDGLVYQWRKTIKDCHGPVSRLMLLKSLDEVFAEVHVEQVVYVCRHIICSQLEILREVYERLNEGDLQKLDQKIVESKECKISVHKSLLCPEAWYEEEQGIEARRALGVLATLTSLSKYSADLLAGLVEPKMKGLQLTEEEKMSCKFREHHLHKACRTQKYGFLKLLWEITKEIILQRRSLELSGLVTGVVVILSKVLIKGSYDEEGLDLVCQIIKEVAFSRPRMDGIIALTKLIRKFSSNMKVMNFLCHNSKKDACAMYHHLGVVFYSSMDSCVIQVLCWMLYGARGIGPRTRLCTNLVMWLSNCISLPNNPVWLNPIPEHTIETCRCRYGLASVLIVLLYKSLGDLNKLRQSSSKEFELVEDLRSVLVKGVMLLENLLVLDTNFGSLMVDSEGEYQQFLNGMNDIRSFLHLNQNEEEALNNLLHIEEEHKPTHMESLCTEAATQALAAIGSNMLLSWRKQEATVQQYKCFYPKTE